MHYRCSVACVLQGAALLLPLAPRSALGAAGAAECGTGAGLACADWWREHDSDEEALLQVRPGSPDESGLLSRLRAVGLDDRSKNGSEDVVDTINSTIQGAVDKANETLSDAMDAVNGAVGWLTDVMNTTRSALEDKLNETEIRRRKNGAVEDADNASISTEVAKQIDEVVESVNATGIDEVFESLGSSPCKGEAPCGEAAKGSKIAPFGNEGMAAELEKQAAKTQDALVEAVENAQVAEIKRAIFRSLTRLRAAQIKEFDTIARLETQAIDDYNDKHHYLAENPLEHISTGEQDPSLDKYTSFHD